MALIPKKNDASRPSPVRARCENRPVPVSDVGERGGDSRRDRLRSQGPDVLVQQQVEQAHLDDEAEGADHPEGGDLLDEDAPGATKPFQQRWW